MNRCSKCGRAEHKRSCEEAGETLALARTMLDEKNVRKMEPHECNMRVWADKQAIEVIDRQKARIRELEVLLKSIRGYMFPGNVMPVPEQAKYIVKWIDSALETISKHEG